VEGGGWRRGGGGCSARNGATMAKSAM
jgi:hypothetical protein